MANTVELFLLEVVPLDHLYVTSFYNTMLTVEEVITMRLTKLAFFVAFEMFSVPFTVGLTHIEVYDLPSIYTYMIGDAMYIKYFTPCRLSLYALLII
jgi:hypothetical protein